MRKKLLIMLAILGVPMVLALGYYAMFSTTFTVENAIEMSTGCTSTIEGIVHSGEIVPGEECTLTNEAPTARDLVITNNLIPEIEVSYMSTLKLVPKETSLWTPIGDESTISYTTIGDEFVVNDIPSGYTLIYYPNLVEDDFATNVANILVYGEDDIEMLPIELDVGDDYCGNGLNYVLNQCTGAKLWLIEGTLSSVEAKAKVLAWNTDGFEFELDLIQFSKTGEITLSPNASLTITPIFTIGANVTGTQVIETTVA